MGIGPVSKASPRKSSPAADLETLRIGAAMEHIKAHGNLDGFAAGRGERLALVSTAVKQGLVMWNRSRGKYELTSRGYRHVRVLRRAGRNALRDRQGGAVRSAMNAVVTAAGAVVVVGAVFLAFNPTGPIDSSPARRLGAYFTSSASAPAPARATQAMQPAAETQPRAVAAAASIDSRKGASEPAAPVPSGGRADASALDGGARGGEAARSLAAAIGGESEIATRAVQKSAAADRDRAEMDPPVTNKPAHKQKKSARRERGRGYAYSP